MALPLSGIHVVDFSGVFAAPFTAMLLADQGAEVIKIESPEGDASRPSVPYLPFPAGMGGRFLTFNRNKRSIVVDVTKPKGRELAYSLFRWADVLVINMRVRTRQRRGFTYEDLAAINPRLIYVSITGFGDEGPDADLPGADITVQARAGDIAVRRPPNGPPPPHTMLFHYDMSASMLAAYAIMLALWERERTGQGQKVGVSLLQAALACNAVNMTRLVGGNRWYGINPPPGLPITYRCSDGRYLLSQSISIGGDRWEGVCRCIGLGHLLDDPRFSTPQKLAQKIEELTDILSRHFSTKPAAEWEAMLKRDSLSVTVVREWSEVYDDPQVIANEMFIRYEQPGIGPVEVINVPFKMSGAGEQPLYRRYPPALGENTTEVLRELGHSPEEIEALRAEGVVA
ncbi:MAG: CoA transferase [Chloroflexota bacterium]